MLARLRQPDFSDWYARTLALCLFVHLVFPKLFVPAFLLVLIATVIGVVRKELKFKLSTIPVLFALFYIAYAVGCLFTRHQDLANHYLESKLSFILFPLLLCFRLTKSFNWKPIVVALVSGSVLLLLMGLWNGYHAYQSTGQLFGSFSGSVFSYVHHPTYYAVFAVIALAGTWKGYGEKWEGFGLLIAILVTLIVIVIHGLCLSLSGLLFFAAVSFFFCLSLVYRKWGKWSAVAAAVVVPVLLVLAVFAVPSIKAEVGDSLHSAGVYIKNPPLYVWSKPGWKTGSEKRLVMWTVGTQEFLQHPMGVGTGNVDEHLNYRLYKSNQKNLIPEELNPHNQFIQTAVEIGVIGLTILLAIVIAGIRLAWRRRDWLLMVTVSALAFNSLFESMLQRSSGIIFFSFLICLLAVYAQQKQADHVD